MGNKPAPRRRRNACGSAIRRIRLSLGWTQEQLAARLQVEGLDLTRFDVAKIEGRWRSVFDYELLLIAKTLKVDIKELGPTWQVLAKELPILRRGFL